MHVKRSCGSFAIFCSAGARRVPGGRDGALHGRESRVNVKWTVDGGLRGVMGARRVPGGRVPRDGALHGQQARGDRARALHLRPARARFSGSLQCCQRGSCCFACRQLRVCAAHVSFQQPQWPARGADIASDIKSASSSACPLHYNSAAFLYTGKAFQYSCAGIHLMQVSASDVNRSNDFPGTSGRPTIVLACAHLHSSELGSEP